MVPFVPGTFWGLPRNGSWHLFLSDDATGGLRLHRTFDSFGNIVSEIHCSTDEYGYSHAVDESELEYVDLAFAFTGRLLDQATGLQNNLNRWYDASIGRWLSEDPIAFAGGDANLYRYVGNGPTMFVDPSGLVQNVGWGLPSWHDYWYYLTHPGEQDKDIQTAQTVAVTTSAVCLVAAGGVAAWGVGGGGQFAIGYGSGHVTFGWGTGGIYTWGHGLGGAAGFVTGIGAGPGAINITGIPIIFPAAVGAWVAGRPESATCATAAAQAFVEGWRFWK